MASSTLLNIKVPNNDDDLKCQYVPTAFNVIVDFLTKKMNIVPEPVNLHGKSDNSNPNDEIRSVEFNAEEYM